VGVVLLLLQARSSSLVVWYMAWFCRLAAMYTVRISGRGQKASSLSVIYCVFCNAWRDVQGGCWACYHFHVQVQDVQRSTTVMWVAGAMPDAESKTVELEHARGMRLIAHSMVIRKEKEMDSVQFAAPMLVTLQNCCWTIGTCSRSWSGGSHARRELPCSCCAALNTELPRLRTARRTRPAVSVSWISAVISVSTCATSANHTAPRALQRLISVLDVRWQRWPSRHLACL
jgi:hypothetical protein